MRSYEELIVEVINVVTVKLGFSKRCREKTFEFYKCPNGKTTTTKSFL